MFWVISIIIVKINVIGIVIKKQKDNTILFNESLKSSNILSAGITNNNPIIILKINIIEEKRIIIMTIYGEL